MGRSTSYERKRRKSPHPLMRGGKGGKHQHRDARRMFIRSGYNGPTASQLKQSLRLALFDQLEKLGFPIEKDDSTINHICGVVGKFLDHFISEMKNLDLLTEDHAPQLWNQLSDEDRFSLQEYAEQHSCPDIILSYQTKILADAMKDQYTALRSTVLDLVDALFLDRETPVACLVSYKPGTAAYIEKIYYLPKQFKFILYDEEEDMTIKISDSPILTHHYDDLMKASVLLIGLLYTKCGEDEFFDRYDDIPKVINVLLSFGEMYTQMNPDNLLLDWYADNSIDGLEEPIDQELSKEFLATWDSFVEDLNQGDKAYIRSLHQAMEDTAEFRSSKFIEPDDFFYSNKGCASRDPSRKSIRGANLCSMIETQLDDPVIQETEELIGYSNHYNPSTGSRSYAVIKTREVRNPGKQKPRLIVFTVGEIQDIANYIKRRLKALTERIVSSCTTAQFKGVQFAKLVTSPSYREKHHNSVYTWDWEDCTNNVRWSADDLTFGLFLPHMLPFWKRLRSYEKSHIYGSPAREQRVFSQKGKGQPQGIGGSFDDMDLFHIVIALLVMKRTGREDMELSSYLRDLGDDDLTSTKSEDKPDPDYPGFRDEPGYRTPCQLEFRSICKEFHLPINDDKSGFNEYVEGASQVYEATFAHVNVRNGKINSPIPPRILAKYYLPAFQLISLNWEIEHDWVCRDFISTILHRISRDPVREYLFNVLYRSGTITNSTFNLYKTRRWEECDNRVRAIIKISYVVQTMKVGAIFSLQSDKDALNELSYRESLDGFKELISSPELEEAYNNICDPCHKMCQLVRRNQEVTLAIKELYGVDHSAAVFGAAELIFSDEVRAGFTRAHAFIDTLHYYEEATDDQFDSFVADQILQMDCSAIIRASQVMLNVFSRRRGRQEVLISAKIVEFAVSVLEFFPTLREEIEGWAAEVLPLEVETTNRVDVDPQEDQK